MGACNCSWGSSRLIVHLQCQRYLPGPLLIALQRTQSLMNTAQEADLESSSFHGTEQKISLGNHDRPKPSAPCIVEPGLGLSHALIEGLLTIRSPDDLHAWMAIVRWKPGRDALAH